jgi:hypothetical protein
MNSQRSGYTRVSWRAQIGHGDDRRSFPFNTGSHTLRLFFIGLLLLVATCTSNTLPVVIAFFGNRTGEYRVRNDDLVAPLLSNFSGQRDMIATAYTLAREPWLEIVGRVGLEQTRDNSLSVGRIDDPNVIYKTA